MTLPRTLLIVAAFVVIGVICAAQKQPWALTVSSLSPRIPEIIFVQAPVVVADELAGRFPEGSRIARLAAGSKDPGEINLTPEFFAAADPQVSFDATKILFSGKVTRDAAWQVWEMHADGSSKRQITHCPGDCLRASYLPQDKIVFSAFDGESPAPSSALYVSKLSDTDAHPITFGPGNFQVVKVLRNGRILVSAAATLVASHRGRVARALYTIRPDGTGLTQFRPNSRENLIGSGAAELGDGTIVFVAREGKTSSDEGGRLAWFRPGALHNSLLTPRQSDFLSARKLQSNVLVVADSAGKTGRFDLYAFDLARRRVGELIYRNADLSSLDAVPLEPHAAPRIYWSILHPQSSTGRVICLNSRLSADAPGGRLRASISRVRVLSLEPDHNRESVLGEAPVEADGSFYIQVPANQPIRFELLNAEGSVIHAQRSWVWTRSGEDMGCLGCHDDKAMSPPNHWPLALKRFDTPIALGLSQSGQTNAH